MADSKVYDLDAMIGLGEPIKLTGEVIGHFRSREAITHRTYAQLGRLRANHARILRNAELLEGDGEPVMDHLDDLMEQADANVAEQLALVTDLSEADRRRIPTLLAVRMVSDYLQGDDAAPKQEQPTPLKKRRA